jgi:hypothetical protein
VGIPQTDTLTVWVDDDDDEQAVMATSKAAQRMAKA